jgi:hypothetical protein
MLLSCMRRSRKPQRLQLLVQQGRAICYHSSNMNTKGMVLVWYVSLLV